MGRLHRPLSTHPCRQLALPKTRAPRPRCQSSRYIREPSSSQDPARGPRSASKAPGTVRTQQDGATGGPRGGLHRRLQDTAPCNRSPPGTERVSLTLQHTDTPHHTVMQHTHHTHILQEKVLGTKRFQPHSCPSTHTVMPHTHTPTQTYTHPTHAHATHTPHTNTHTS